MNAIARISCCQEHRPACEAHRRGACRAGEAGTRLATGSASGAGRGGL